MNTKNKHFLIHELGHLLFYLKAIKKDKNRMIRNYNKILSIEIGKSYGYFITDYYYINKNDDFLVCLGGVIMDKYYNYDYDYNNYISDFNEINKLGFSKKQIHFEIIKQSNLIVSKELYFIDEMVDKFCKTQINDTFKITLKDMDEIICKHFPIFKNCLYTIPYKIK